MGHAIELEPTKTYASIATLERAVAKVEERIEVDALRYLVQTTPEGRIYPVFIGMRAFDAIHLGHCVVN